MKYFTMGCASNISIIVLLISLVTAYFVYEYLSPPPVPKVELNYWGPGKEKPDDKTIKPYKIKFPESDLEDLRKRISNTRTLTPPIVDGFNYGFNTVYLNKFVEFWKNKYNWTERETYLNKYPQFTTEIAGLDIHFIHAKPDKSLLKGRKVLPLLMIHGWPGSVVEFYKIIPMLTTPRPDADFVFEVIAPSLPGYAFSEAASKPGLHHGHIGLIFNELMDRLGFKQYYVQGGDWGSIIGRAISILRPDRVLGYHSNSCAAETPKAKLYMLLFYFFPKLFIEESLQEKYVSQFPDMLHESGYFHLQATKPDTIGVALTDSPVGLAAYILEKFSTWTDREWRSLQDGGLENLDKVELLDNIMIYWLTNSITTSMRLYKEYFADDIIKHGLFQGITTVPTGCIFFKHEIAISPRQVLELGYSNLISYNLQTKGGHFAALELPEILSADIWNFLKLLMKQK
ncbi:juvenile hormone epoxide hydrolase 2 isoform X1 [Halyomorpha halys]|uniref:juvenile hormone epoxide hydrolase 2 isoform X1 n=2 Tax=Halyomorpha halys TaxID=286706 RepID=UPI0006D4E3E4|nr:juvenile hormone epoxide hydrolase 2-like isoform X1 [Halyomorpha halys]